MSSGSAMAVGQPVREGVGWIPAGFVNIYTFQHGDHIYLIDTGFGRNARPVVGAFRKANVPWDRVGKILLTHHHVDHTGGAAYLLRLTHAPVACHEADAPYVEGREKARTSRLMRLFVRVHPAPVAIQLRDGDRVGPLVALHLPGHTPGNVAFHDPEKGILFSGDSVVERDGKLTLPAVRFAADIGQAVRSLDRLRGLTVKMLLPGHGHPVQSGFAPMLDDLIRRAPVEFLSQSHP